MSGAEKEDEMSTRTQADREFDWATGRELERKDAEIMWLRSSLVSLLTLAEAEPSPLTNAQVATICRVTLDKHPAQSGGGKNGEPGEPSPSPLNAGR